VLRATLGELGELDIENPAVLVVGAVAALDLRGATELALAYA